MASTRVEYGKKRPEVGFTKIGKHTLCYADIPVDKNGWADASRFLPLRCDLVYLQMADRESQGWWAGAYWYGPRVKETDIVKAWRFMEHQYD